MSEQQTEQQSTTLGAGPPAARVDREAMEGKVRAALWRATWEASQFLTYGQIRETVEGTLREIKADEP